MSLVVDAAGATRVVAPMIVGGTNASSPLTASVARIITGNSGLCTGAFISNQWVLTAGHCIDSSGTATIFTGTADTSYTRIGTAVGYRHPDYVEATPQGYWLRNDIGLYRLDQPTTLVSAFAVPATTTDSAAYAPGATVTAFGWGLTKATDTQPASILQMGNMTLLADDRCFDLDLGRGADFDSATEICAQGANLSMCRGDSGGPWFGTSNGAPVIVAVTSYGVPACNAHSVGGWVPGALTWIRAVTGLPLAGASATGASPNTVRIFGLDRYESASATGGYWETKRRPVFVATGANYPDSLAAGASAARLDVPLLLVTPTSVPMSTRIQLRRLAPTEINVAGGPAAVSDAVLAELRSITGVTPVRRAGATRYETAQALTSLAWPSGGAADVWIASGQNYQDPLVASSAAAVYDRPFVLVNGKGQTLTDSQRALIRSLGATRLHVVSGPGELSDAVLAQLAELGTVIRYSDPDPSVRSASVWAPISTKSAVSIATSLNFPDALSSVPFTTRGTSTAPLFLVPGTCVPAATRNEIVRLSNGRVNLFGGPAAVGSGVEALTQC